MGSHMVSKQTSAVKADASEKNSVPDMKMRESALQPPSAVHASSDPPADDDSVARASLTRAKLARSSLQLLLVVMGCCTVERVPILQRAVDSVITQWGAIGSSTKCLIFAYSNRVLQSDFPMCQLIHRRGMWMAYLQFISAEHFKGSNYAFLLQDDVLLNYTQKEAKYWGQWSSKRMCTKLKSGVQKAACQAFVPGIVSLPRLLEILQFNHLDAISPSTVGTHFYWMFMRPEPWQESMSKCVSGRKVRYIEQQATLFNIEAFQTLCEVAIKAGQLVHNVESVGDVDNWFWDFFVMKRRRQPELGVVYDMQVLHVLKQSTAAAVYASNASRVLKQQMAVHFKGAMRTSLRFMDGREFSKNFKNLGDVSNCTN